MLTSSHVESLAMLAHEAYLRSPADPGREEPARRPWADLDEAHRAQNRDQVQVLLGWLELKDHHVAPASDGDPGAVDLEGLVEEHARYEHARWMHLRIEQGYRYGPVRNDEVTAERPQKTHPDLVPWAELTDAAKDKDRAALRTLVEHLSTMGLTLR